MADASPENLKKLAANAGRGEDVHRPRRLADAVGPDAGGPGRLQQGGRPEPRHPAVPHGARDDAGRARPAAVGPDDRATWCWNRRSSIFPWSGDVYPSDDAFTNVVDLDDVAPFCKAGKDSFLWGQITNGLVSADAWVFIYEHNIKDDPHPKWTADLPKEEEVIGFSIVPNAFDNRLTKLKLTFHGAVGDESETLDLKPENTLQDFELKPHRCKSITLEPLEWTEAGKRPLIGIDNIWIRVKRSDEYRKTVVAAAEHRGAGEIQDGRRRGRAQRREGAGNREQPRQRPEEAEHRFDAAAQPRRRVRRRARAGRPAPNLKYTPIPLGDKCNQFLTKEKGWYEGGDDLSRVPGRRKHAVGGPLRGARLQARRRCRPASCWPAPA